MAPAPPSPSGMQEQPMGIKRQLYQFDESFEILAASMSVVRVSTFESRR